MGKEFYNSHVKRVLNRYRVHHFSTDQPLKVQIVECFNRTQREMLKQSMAYRKSLDYISVLSDYLYGYNARPHTAFLPFAPREVNKNNEAQVHELQYGEYLRQQKAKHKYSIGDHVRKAINKGAFSKSYKFKNISEKLYEIIDTVHTMPPMYHLKDLRTGNVLDGAVYQEQIQRVRDTHKNEETVVDAQMHHPFRCLVAGPSQSDKSAFVHNLLLWQNDIIDIHFDYVTIVLGTEANKNEILFSLRDELRPGVMEIIELKKLCETAELMKKNISSDFEHFVKNKADRKKRDVLFLITSC